MTTTMKDSALAEDDCLNAPISALEWHGLSLRVINVLEERMGIFTVRHLRSLTAKEFLKEPMIGVSVLRELQRALESFLLEREDRVGGLREVAKITEECIDLAGKLRQHAARRGCYKQGWWPVDRRLMRQAANAMEAVSRENNRLCMELRRLKGT